MSSLTHQPLYSDDITFVFCDSNELVWSGVYVKVSLRKMLGRRMCKELHKEIKLEVDGKHVELPPIEGIIILNIMRWVRVSRSKIFFSMVYFPRQLGLGRQHLGSGEG